MFLTEMLEKKFVITAEVMPPKGSNDKEAFMKKASALAKHVDFINIVDSASALGSVESAKLLEEAGIKTITHVAARDRSREQLREIIDKAVGYGLKNFLCMTGRTGGNVSVFELIEILKENDVCVGAVCDPYSPALPKEIERVKEKILSGSDFIMTQPVFATEDAKSFLKKCEVKTPFIFGVPMVNFGWVQVFKSVDIKVPEWYEMNVRKNEEYSMEFARKMVSGLKNFSPGAYVIPYSMEKRFGDLMK